MVKLPPGASDPRGPAPKDRNFTRRSVAGAAGGMLGVDYEDLRPREGIGTERASPVRADAGAAGPAPGPIAPKEALRPGGAPKDEAEMILDDEDAATRDVKARRNRRPLVSRDRFTIDKDAPDRHRRLRWDLLEDQDDPSEDKDEPVDLDALAEAICSAGDNNPRVLPGQRRLLGRPGDPSLTDPGEAMRELGTPLFYAQHAMLLAEAFRVRTGAARAEVIAYLGSLFAALPDRRFARSAVRELGFGTGVVEIYPLEVVVYLLDACPGLLRRTRYAPIFTGLSGTLRAAPHRALELKLPEDVRVRSFALVGGPRPGYRFEPARSPGQYRLVLGAVGDFEILVGARPPDGGTVLERILVEVRGDGPAARPPPEPLRDPAAVAAWPWPSVLPLGSVSDPEEPDDDHDDHLSLAERVARTELDALRGPKGDSEGFGFRGIVVDGSGSRTPEAARAAESWARAGFNLPPPPRTLAERLQAPSASFRFESAEALEALEPRWPEPQTPDPVELDEEGAEQPDGPSTEDGPPTPAVDLEPEPILAPSSQGHAEEPEAPVAFRRRRSKGLPMSEDPLLRPAGVPLPSPAPAQTSDARFEPTVAPPPRPRTGMLPPSPAVVPRAPLEDDKTDPDGR